MKLTLSNAEAEQLLEDPYVREQLKSTSVYLLHPNGLPKYLDLFGKRFKTVIETPACAPACGCQRPDIPKLAHVRNCPCDACPASRWEVREIVRNMLRRQSHRPL